jgi:hypothetical protein
MSATDYAQALAADKAANEAAISSLSASTMSRKVLPIHVAARVSGAGLYSWNRVQVKDSGRSNSSSDGVAAASLDADGSVNGQWQAHGRIGTMMK